MESDLRDAVRAASNRAEVGAAVDALYREVEGEIDARRPLCVVSGKCCRFEEYGHRLYVTTLELASFVRQHSAAPDATWDGTGCPFQRSKLCTVHSIRPFGCRMFFCDATSTQWQNDAYERFHDQLKRVHAELNVPYYYVEWRTALQILGLAPRPATDAGV
jgi:Fe-S-cluster containining protein